MTLPALPTELVLTVMLVPAGSAVYFEIRHYKAAERRLSTLAWSYIPTEAFVLQQSAGEADCLTMAKCQHLSSP